MKNREDEIRFTLGKEKETIDKMQNDVELKEKRAADERVNISRRIQSLKKAEEDLRHSAYKIKAKKNKSQHTFQIDPYTSVDKNLDELLIQLEDP